MPPLLLLNLPLTRIHTHACVLQVERVNNFTSQLVETLRSSLKNLSARVEKETNKENLDQLLAVSGGVAAKPALPSYAVHAMAVLPSVAGMDGAGQEHGLLSKRVAAVVDGVVEEIAC